MFNNINFEFPYILLLILVFIFCSIYCKEKTATYLIPHLHIFQKSNQKSSIFINILKSFVVLFSIIALASPIRISDHQIIKNDGINIILNLDASGSMKYRDLDRSDDTKNRFDVVKEVVKSFITERKNDNIGLVVFGDSVMMASPLSFDKDAQKEIVDYLEVEMLGSKTAMIDSLASSINILKDKDAKSNVIILLSDGEDNISKIPFDVIIRLVKKYKIKVYSIGIGKANKLALNNIAKQSKGKYYAAYSKEDLSLIYEDINILEKSKIDQNKIILKEYLFFYPLFLAIVCLIGFIYLKNKE